MEPRAIKRPEAAFGESVIFKLEVTIVLHASFISPMVSVLTLLWFNEKRIVQID